MMLDLKYILLRNPEPLPYAIHLSPSHVSLDHYIIVTMWGDGRMLHQSATGGEIEIVLNKSPPSMYGNGTF